MQFIICIFVSKVIYYMWFCVENAICYKRFCIKMRFIICEFISKWDLLYAILYWNTIYVCPIFMSKCDLLYVILHHTAIYYMRFLYQNVIYYMRLRIKIRFIICDCIKMRFIISDFYINYDLLYAILHQHMI